MSGATQPPIVTMGKIASLLVPIMPVPKLLHVICSGVPPVVESPWTPVPGLKAVDMVGERYLTVAAEPVPVTAVWPPIVSCSWTRAPWPGGIAKTIEDAEYVVDTTPQFGHEHAVLGGGDAKAASRSTAQLGHVIGSAVTSAGCGTNGMATERPKIDVGRPPAHAAAPSW
jgi:hypothetical protein